MSRTYYVVKEPPRLYYNRFFAAIRDKPALWDSSHKDFENSKVTQNLWNEVAKMCGNCRGARAHIEFIRKRKTYAKFLTGKRDHWAYTSQMAFLDQEIFNNLSRKSPSGKMIGSESVEASAAEDVEEDSDMSDFNLALGDWHSTPIQSGSFRVQSLLATPVPKREQLSLLSSSPKKDVKVGFPNRQRLGMSPAYKMAGTIKREPLSVSPKKPIKAGFPIRPSVCISRISPSFKLVPPKRLAGPIKRETLSVPKAPNRQGIFGMSPIYKMASPMQLTRPIKKEPEEERRAEYRPVKREVMVERAEYHDDLPYNLDTSIESLSSLVRMDDIDSEDDDEMEGRQHEQTHAATPTKEAAPAAAAAATDEMEGLEHDQTHAAKEAVPAEAAASIDEVALGGLAEQPLGAATVQIKPEPRQEVVADTVPATDAADPASTETSGDEIDSIDYDEPVKSKCNSFRAVLEAMKSTPAHLSAALIQRRKSEIRARGATPDVIEVVQLESDGEEKPVEKPTAPRPSRRGQKVVAGDEAGSDVVVLGDRRAEDATREIVRLQSEAGQDVMWMDGPPAASAASAAAAPSARTTRASSRSVGVVEQDGKTAVAAALRKCRRMPDAHLDDNTMVADEQAVLPAAAASAAPRARTAKVSSRSVEAIKKDGKTAAPAVPSTRKIVLATSADPMPDAHLDDNTMVADEQAVVPAAAASAAPRARAAKVSSRSVIKQDGKTAAPAPPSTRKIVPATPADPVPDAHLDDNTMVADEQTVVPPAASAAAPIVPAALAAPDASKVVAPAPRARTAKVSSRSVIKQDGKTAAPASPSTRKIVPATPADPMPDAHLDDNTMVADEQAVVPPAAAAAAAPIVPAAPAAPGASKAVAPAAAAAAPIVAAVKDAPKAVEKKQKRTPVEKKKLTPVEMAINFQNLIYYETDLDKMQKLVKRLERMPFASRDGAGDQTDDSSESESDEEGEETSDEEAESEDGAEPEDESEPEEVAEPEDESEPEEEAGPEPAVVPSTPPGSPPPPSAPSSPVRAARKRRLARGSDDDLSKTAKKRGKKETEARPSTEASNWARGFWRKAAGRVDTKKMTDFSLPDGLLGANDKKTMTTADEKPKRKRGRLSKEERLKRAQAEEAAALVALVETARDIDEDQPSTSRGRVSMGNRWSAPGPRFSPSIGAKKAKK